MKLQLFAMGFVVAFIPTIIGCVLFDYEGAKIGAMSGLIYATILFVASAMEN